MQWIKIETGQLSNHMAITAVNQHEFVRIAEKKSLLVSLGLGRWKKVKMGK